ncbi:MAG TPA: hypothetical protein VGJ26_13810 [Pirellulales bacterium]|jgi:hypothetical protein
MRRYVGPMLIAVAMIAVVGIGGVEKAQAAPGFFSFSVGSPGYGPAGYSASFGAYPQPYYPPVPSCGVTPYGAVPYASVYGPAAYGAYGGYGGYGGYGAYYRPLPAVPYYGHHGHHGYGGYGRHF